MSKYTELDAAIVHAVQNGATTFSGLRTACSQHLSFKMIGREYTDDRLLDRRLQALRKAGRITFAMGHWSIA
ncbi:hypothetical protein [Xanthomonas translucens]|uniref:hypothetical protein n=1 Tax=Xanthomonas campestris pv. translucens TaxID=343 RepID=UPI00071E6913|nr:hypothetical protein [Xanthomonas translucens]QEN93598.1 hypothetical protein F0H33_09615 [Xanthomonas translucens pv. undulosa]QSQ58089.1 hypothetical protein ISN37_09220 [Xanthomonas translucens pv. undulosa]WLA02754.1 hypothetical protein MO330_09715 [Xanthomonas translucens]